jgi:hypothetical protein
MNWSNSNAWGDHRPPLASSCRPLQAAEECERAKKAEFKGAPVSNNWSNPTAWVGGTVPVSDPELKVQLKATDGIEDLGDAKAPFFTDDVIGVAGKLGFPTLDVTGFLHADTVRNLADIETDGCVRR